MKKGLIIFTIILLTAFAIAHLYADGDPLPMRELLTLGDKEAKKHKPLNLQWNEDSWFAYSSADPSRLIYNHMLLPFDKRFEVIRGVKTVTEISDGEVSRKIFYEYDSNRHLKIVSIINVYNKIEFPGMKFEYFYKGYLLQRREQIDAHTEERDEGENLYYHYDHNIGAWRILLYWEAGWVNSVNSFYYADGVPFYESCYDADGFVVNEYYYKFKDGLPVIIYDKYNSEVEWFVWAKKSLLSRTYSTKDINSSSVEKWMTKCGYTMRGSSKMETFCASIPVMKKGVKEFGEERKEWSEILTFDSRGRIVKAEVLWQKNMPDWESKHTVYRFTYY